MNQYRIVLFAKGGDELSSGYLFASDDESACASAERLMQSNARASEVQVLADERMVCRRERT